MDSKIVDGLKAKHGEDNLLGLKFKESGETLIIKKDVSKELYTIVKSWLSRKDELTAMEVMLAGLCVHGDAAKVSASIKDLLSAKPFLEELLYVEEAEIVKL